MKYRTNEQKRHLTISKRQRQTARLQMPGLHRTWTALPFYRSESHGRREHFSAGCHTENVYNLWARLSVQMQLLKGLKKALTLVAEPPRTPGSKVFLHSRAFQSVFNPVSNPVKCRWCLLKCVCAYLFLLKFKVK